MYMKTVSVLQATEKSKGHHYSKMEQVLSLLGQKYAKDWLAQLALIPYKRINAIVDRQYCSTKIPHKKFIQQNNCLLSWMVPTLQNCTNFYG